MRAREFSVYVNKEEKWFMARKHSCWKISYAEPFPVLFRLDHEGNIFYKFYSEKISKNKNENFIPLQKLIQDLLFAYDYLQ